MMLNTPMARRGMVTAPHHLASQAALAVLREGGNAIEAAVAAAATLSVVYPHMTGLGGDGFWLIAEPGKPPVSIDGSGAAAAQADLSRYRSQKLRVIPERGALAAVTVAGAVSGWQLALDVSSQWGGGIPLERLFEDAIHYARNGAAITRHQAEVTHRDLAALRKFPGFAKTFLTRNKAPFPGAIQTQPQLAATLERLAQVGLDDFYRGEIARSIANDLKTAGSMLKSDDLARHRGMRRRPLSLGLSCGTLFNAAPPSQGLAALILQGVCQRLGTPQLDGFEWIHGLVEATKQAYHIRDKHLADPQRMAVHAATYLSDHILDRMAADIDRTHASPWPHLSREGDTTWIGVIDGQGRAVSYIQSLYGAFGSGLLLEGTGVLWHNRGCCFSLDPQDRNALEPRRKTRHTLSPALARLKDGRVMVWGSMGGDAQPQILAQIFSRIVTYGMAPQAALSAPRFIVGKTAEGCDLRLEAGFGAPVVEALEAAGHAVSRLDAFSPVMGQAGALVRRNDGMIEGGGDPRADGAVAGW